MQEIAFTMQLKRGVADEYRRRHDNIWPELTQALTDAGTYNYSIYLNPQTGTLFAA